MKSLLSFAHRDAQRSHVVILLPGGALAVVCVLLLNAGWPTLLEPLELWSIDLRFRLRPLLPISSQPFQEKSDRFVTIDYDDRAARQYGLGRWPWDRRVHAHVIDILKKAGAKVVMVDLLFEHEADDPSEDRLLAEATHRAGMVIYPMALRPVREQDSSESVLFTAARHLLHAEVTGVGELPGGSDVTLPLPALAAAAGGLRHIQRTSEDSAPLCRERGFVPALPFAAALHSLEADSVTLRIERGQAIRFKTRHGDEITIPIDRDGRTWINYAGPWGTRFVHYPYSWMLDQLRTPEGKAHLLERFKDRSVLVSNLTTGSGDRVATPFEPHFPTSEVALHLLNMLTSRQFLRNATAMEAALILIVPVLLVTGSALMGGPTVMIPTLSIVLTISLLILQTAFNRGVILPAVNTPLALIIAVGLLLIARFFIVDRERIRFQTVLGACLPPQTIQIICDYPDCIPSLLAGHSRELTVLFADIQGFSGFCKRAGALEIQRVLRDYLNRDD